MVGLAVIAVAATSVPYFAHHPAQWRSFAEVNLNHHVDDNSGNFGFAYMIYLLRAWATGTAGGFDPFLSAMRYGTLAAAALLVLLSRTNETVASSVTLMLAHFLTYAEVWEHHSSGVVVLGVLLLWTMDRPERSPRRFDALARGFAIAALIALVLPTLSGWFDVEKDPHAWDPMPPWSLLTRALVTSCKAVPTLVLFLIACREVAREGLGLKGARFRQSELPN